MRLIKTLSFNSSGVGCIMLFNTPAGCVVGSFGGSSPECMTTRPSWWDSLRSLSPAQVERVITNKSRTIPRRNLRLDPSEDQEMKPPHMTRKLKSASLKETQLMWIAWMKWRLSSGKSMNRWTCRTLRTLQGSLILRSHEPRSPMVLIGVKKGLSLTKNELICQNYGHSNCDWNRAHTLISSHT